MRGGGPGLNLMPMVRNVRSRKFRTTSYRFKKKLFSSVDYNTTPMFITVNSALMAILIALLAGAMGGIFVGSYHTFVERLPKQLQDKLHRWVVIIYLALILFCVVMMIPSAQLM